MSLYPSILLASKSPRRAALLRQIGAAFKAVPTGADETIPPDMAPKRVVETLAMRKARAASLNAQKDSTWKQFDLTLGADTVVCLNGLILGKPNGVPGAMRMLQTLSGKTHRVLTGIALIWKSGAEEAWHEETRVTFRNLSDREIEAYAKTGGPMDKAGAYGIQEQAGAFAARIEGCYFNVVGLPLARLAERLLEPS